MSPQSSLSHLRQQRSAQALQSCSAVLSCITVWCHKVSRSLTDVEPCQPGNVLLTGVPASCRRQLAAAEPPAALTIAPACCKPLAVCGLQRDNNFYPAWAYVFPTTLLRLPYSIGAAFLWAAIVYYPVSPHLPPCGIHQSFVGCVLQSAGPQACLSAAAQGELMLSAVHLSRP